MKIEIGRQGGFVVEHCYTCAVPGYLIVSSSGEVSTLDTLPPTCAAQIGTILAGAVAMVNALVAPVRVYCAQFGEEQTRLHFHVFPRSEALTKEYLAAFPEHSLQIRGPIVLDWARDRYRRTSEEVWEVVSPTVERMRQWWTTQQGIPVDRSADARFRVGGASSLRAR